MILQTLSISSTSPGLPTTPILLPRPGDYLDDQQQYGDTHYPEKYFLHDAYRMNSLYLWGMIAVPVRRSEKAKKRSDPNYSKLAGPATFPGPCRATDHAVWENRRRWEIADLPGSPSPGSNHKSGQVARRGSSPMYFCHSACVMFRSTRRQAASIRFSNPSICTRADPSSPAVRMREPFLSQTA